MSEPVTRLRATVAVDRYGAAVLDWSAPDELLVEGCALAPVAEGEDHAQGRAGVLVGWTLYAPANADITAGDRVVARGETCDVDGQPGRWANPFTRSPVGTEIMLRRVDG